MKVWVDGTVSKSLSLSRTLILYPIDRMKGVRYTDEAGRLTVFVFTDDEVKVGE